MAKKDLTGKRWQSLWTKVLNRLNSLSPEKHWINWRENGNRVASGRAGKRLESKKWGKFVGVDTPLESADAASYDALLLPGGVMNPDKLRTNPKAVEFVKHFFDAGKPVAAICHGPWMVIEAGGASGRTLTSWPSLKTDIGNAGGLWVDQEVATDQGLVTSRKPDDIKAFNKTMIEEFAEGQHKVGTGERQIA